MMMIGKGRRRLVRHNAASIVSMMMAMTGSFLLAATAAAQHQGLVPCPCATWDDWYVALEGGTMVEDNGIDHVRVRLAQKTVDGYNKAYALKDHGNGSTTTTTTIILQQNDETSSSNTNNNNNWLCGFTSNMGQAGSLAPLSRSLAIDEEQGKACMTNLRRYLANRTAQTVEDFFRIAGGRDMFSEHYQSALEVLIYGEDDVKVGNYAAARMRLRALFQQYPLSNTTHWKMTGESNGVPSGLHAGQPVAYYGLRMLDQITAAGDVATTDTLRMTVVVAPCAQVTRPADPLDPSVSETVDLFIHPGILADDAHVLRSSTDLFRRWVKAITRGLEVELTVRETTGCTTVDYTDDGERIRSYMDEEQMIASLPADVIDGTDIWWLLSPSGIPGGGGTGYARQFITGGMGSYGPMGQPVFLSDDMWLIRKIMHLGEGPFLEIERRAYLPQWTQHEFMHYLFRRWPQFHLEDTPHQWFDREVWPSDFEGIFEPDYYAEAIAKRFSSASPGLAEGLLQKRGNVDSLAVGLMSLVGYYQRVPIQNNFHDISVALTNGNSSQATWTVGGGSTSWSLSFVDGRLMTGPECPYGVKEVALEVDDKDLVIALWFQGARFGRVVGLGNIVGRYRRLPIENDFHDVTVAVSANNASQATWTVGGGSQSWYLSFVDGRRLMTGPECPYGILELDVEVYDDTSLVTALWFQGARFGRYVELLDLVGSYQRLPVENHFHDVSVAVNANNGSEATWTVGGGSPTWSLSFVDGRLTTGPECPYGELEVAVEVNRDNSLVTALWFQGAPYWRRVGLREIVGHYRRLPLENNFHEISVTVNDAATHATWTVDGGTPSWTLSFAGDDDKLMTGPECPYGVLEVGIEVDSRNEYVVTALWFQGDRYGRARRVYHVDDAVTAEFRCDLPSNLIGLCVFSEADWEGGVVATTDGEEEESSDFLAVDRWVPQTSAATLTLTNCNSRRLRSGNSDDDDDDDDACSVECLDLCSCTETSTGKDCAATEALELPPASSPPPTIIGAGPTKTTAPVCTLQRDKQFCKELMLGVPAAPAHDDRYLCYNFCNGTFWSACDAQGGDCGHLPCQIPDAALGTINGFVAGCQNADRENDVAGGEVGGGDVTSGDTCYPAINEGLLFLSLSLWLLSTFFW